MPDSGSAGPGAEMPIARSGPSDGLDVRASSARASATIPVEIGLPGPARGHRAPLVGHRGAPIVADRQDELGTTDFDAEKRHLIPYPARKYSCGGAEA